MMNIHESFDPNPKIEEFLKKIEGNLQKNRLAFNALNDKFKEENNNVDIKAAIELILVSEISSPRFSEKLAEISKLICFYSSILEVTAKLPTDKYPKVETAERMGEIEERYLIILKEIFGEFFTSS